ncbi:MAG TPA: 23S rRNA (guanosine(2251)-2'-O)-methyltransferase RlmB [Acidimicrobiales bacterium]|nr:23S rRNA (guanosine(2251)-2'-O)-methyltransferase RlmB [Acidimicrobiales bacterium]
MGGDQVEGRRAVRELLAAGHRPVHEVWMAEDLDPSPVLDEIERLAARRHARLQVVPRRRLEAAARTDAPQGVMARAGSLPETDLDDLCRTRRGAAPFLVVFDGVTDPHNLGSLLRSAECAGVTGVVVPRHRAAHVTPTVTKVAAGAIEHLDMALVPGIPNALQRITQAGVTTIGLDASAPMSLFALSEGHGGVDVTGPLALVIGAEGKGLAPLTRRRCAVLVSIPQHGTIESLNVASAGAVAFFALARTRAGRADGPVAAGGRSTNDTVAP